MLNNLKEYAELRWHVLELQEELDRLKATIREDMIANNKYEIRTPYALFYLANTRIWTYPKEVLDAKNAWKALLINARQEGTATYVPNYQLKFRSESYRNNADIKIGFNTDTEGVPPAL